MRVRKILLLSLLITLLCGSVEGAEDAATADAALAAGNYSAAVTAYAAALEDEQTDPGQRLRMRLGLAEAKWRLAAEENNSAGLQAARRELDELARQTTRATPGDVLPRVHLSLGFSYLQGDLPDHNRAWSHFEKALSYWASDRRVELARDRYLSIIRTLAEQAQSVVIEAAPVEALQDVLKVAETPEDAAIAHFLLGRKLARDTAPQQRSRAGAEFAAAAESGGNSPFLPQILFHYAQWASENGATTYTDQGELVLEPDYSTAVSLYGQVVQTAPETALAEQAQREIKAIRRPSLTVRAPNTFLPNTQPHVLVLRRNVEAAELVIYPLPLDALAPQGQSFDDWLDAADISTATPVYQATINRQPERPHLVVSDTVWIETTLAPGAYIATTNGGEQSDRALLLVGERALALKTAEGEALVYYCDAATGAPVAGATVTLHSLRAGQWEKQSTVSGEDGLARFAVQDDSTKLVAIGLDTTQIALATHEMLSTANDESNWQIYAFAARDVYYTGETVSWKALVRQEMEGALVIPATDKPFQWRLLGPGQTVAASGEAALSANGTLYGELTLGADRPLGAYTFRLLDAQGQLLGEAPLLHLLEDDPEQLAAEIQLQPSLNGPGYNPGETIRGTARLTYGFGGPVANAELELQVLELPMIAEGPGFPPSGTDAAPLLHQALRTDSQGQASFDFPTIPDRDSRYLIELRAQDSTGLSARARRTVNVSQENVRITLLPRKRLFLNGEPVQVDISARDTGGRAIAVRGQVRLLRDYWREIWVDRRGREISGKELRELEASSGGWFSFGPSPRDYRLKSEGYQTSDVTEAVIFTDAATGAAQFSWESAEPGYYRLIWMGEEEHGRNVRAVTSFWVAGADTEDIGYRPNTVRLITNDEPVRPGEPFPVLIATPADGRHVLVTGGRRELELVKVLTLEGTARLVQLTLPPGPESVHTLEATIIAEGIISSDRTQVVVSEANDQLQVKITPDAERYSSSQSAEWTVQVNDGSGNPVAGAEVSFSVVNSAATGQIVRPAPEKFFLPHGQDALQATSSLEQRPFFMPLRSSSEAAQQDPAAGIFRQAQTGFMLQERAAAGVSEALTVAWRPTLVTDGQGQVKVETSFPGKSIDWKATARAVLGDTAFGEAEAAVTTRLPLTARASVARMVQLGDAPGLLLTLSNHTASERTATVQLQTSGSLNLADGSLEQVVAIPPLSDLQLSWGLQASTEGTGAVTVNIVSDEVSEVIERQVEVQQRRRIITSARIYGGDNLTLTLPENVAELSPFMRVSATPSFSAIAAGMAPDLLEGQRETTQETLLRFAPGLVLTGVLRTLGYENPQINAHADRDLTGELQAAAQAGLESLRRAQRASGGWGWREGEPEDAFISAYTVILLTLAAEAGAPIPDNLLEKGRIYLGQRLVDSTDTPDRKAWQLLALAARYEDMGRPTRMEAHAMIDIIRDQERLSGFGLAAVALAARDYGLAQEANALVEALVRRVKRDEMGRAYWSAPPALGNLSDFEATALALRAIVVTHGPSELTHDAFAYLLGKPPHTLNTREKATLVVTLAQLAYETGEIEAEAEFDVMVNGRRLGHGKIEPWSALSAQYRWEVPASLIRGGQNNVGVSRLSARTPIVLSAWAEWTPSGRERRTLPQLSISRRYLRTKLAPTLLRGLVEEVVELDNPGEVTLGDRLTSVITLEVTELVRRVVVEDPRPPLAEVIGGAGMTATPIHLINQNNPEQQIVAYVRHNAGATLFYIPDLPTGKWELRIPMRVESLGVFDVSSVRAAISPQNNDAATGLSHRLEARLR